MKTKPTAIKSKIRTARQRARLVRRIRRVAEEMRALGVNLEYYGGFAEIAQHGREMQGAANIALGWAQGIEKLK